MGLIYKSFLAGSLIALVVLVLVYALQRKLVYFPNTARTDPGELDLPGFGEIIHDMHDGAKIVSWYRPADEGRATLLYFHGNAGALIDRAERLRVMGNHGYGVLIMSYRGYSGSSGTPSQKANIADGLHLYDWLVARLGSAGKIVVYGVSLGSGVGVQVAAQRRPVGVILEAPFSSAVDIGAEVYPFLPVRLLMSERYESTKYIAAIKAPVLIVHGQRDNVVPAKFGRKLFDAASDPKTFILLPDGGHSDLYSHGAWQHYQAFLEKL